MKSDTHALVSPNHGQHAYVFRCRKLDIEKRDPIIVVTQSERFIRQRMEILSERFERRRLNLARQVEHRRTLADPFTEHRFFSFGPVVIFPEVLREIRRSIANQSDSDHAQNFASSLDLFNGATLPNSR